MASTSLGVCGRVLSTRQYTRNGRERHVGAQAEHESVYITRRREALLGAAVLSSSAACAPAFDASAGAIAELQQMIEQTDAQLLAPTEADDVDVLRSQRAYLQKQLELTQANAEWLNATVPRICSGDTKFVQHAVVEVDDLDNEVEFFKGAFGMRTLRQRSDESGNKTIFVGFGPESLQAEDGGCFSFELTEKQKGAEKCAFGNAVDYFQICSPNLIRVSKVTDTGGEVLYGFGYFDLRSPNGIPIRAYVGRRRDPFELVALNSEQPSQLGKFYTDTLGMQKASRIPKYNDYIPKKPKGVSLYSYDNDTNNSVSLLVKPVSKGYVQEGNMFKRLALLTNNTERDADMVRNAQPAGTVEFVGQIPGIGTRVGAFRDPSNNGVVFVQYEDFEKELA